MATEPAALGVRVETWRSEADGCVGLFVMERDAAIFRDHFPGRPLLPAIGTLDLCHWMIRRWRGPGARPAALRRVRLLRPVRPPARLEIALTAAAGGRVAMRVRSPAGEHATGDVILSAARGSDAHDPDVSRRESDGAGATGREAGDPVAGAQDAGLASFSHDAGLASFSHDASLASLPHGPALRLVAGVSARDGESIVCRCRIPAGFPWGDRDPLPAFMALEGLAQAAGVLGAWPAAGEDGPADPVPRSGSITRIREAALAGPDLDPGRPWRAEVAVAGRSGGLLLCSGVASQEGRRLLTARIGLYLEPSGHSR